jgi:ubiquinone/menaquinone biosynthesis C-methylase UbiE
VDKNAGMVASAKSDPNPTNVRFVAADAYDLPLSGESVDNIVALGRLAYIGDISRLFAEFRRVLRQGGKIMVTDSVVREKTPVVAAAEEFGLHLVDEAEGHCRAAAGPINRRRLLVLEGR